MSISHRNKDKELQEAFSFTPEGDRHMHPVTFLYETESRTTFVWNSFWYIAYFWQRQVLKWIYFARFSNFNISKMAIFRAP